jgi:DNA transposition AAA+ family ATPase
MTTTEKTADQLQAELISAAKQITEQQSKQGVSDAQWCRRYANLGSTKTYKRLQAGDTDGMDIERQHLLYREALSQVELDAQVAPTVEPVYPDFTGPASARIAVADAFRAIDNTRLVVIQGGTGSGKTSILQIIAEKYPNNSLFLTASTLWKAGKGASAMIDDFYRVTRAQTIERDTRTSGRSDSATNNEKRHFILQFLRTKKWVILVDEGHSINPDGLNFIKEIINETDAVVCLAAFESLFRRLEQTAYQDAVQLMRNRLSERIGLGHPTEREVSEFLTRRKITFDPADKAAIVKHLSTESGGLGNWKFVNLVTRELTRQKCDIGKELYMSAYQTVLRTR